DHKFLWPLGWSAFLFIAGLALFFTVIGEFSKAALILVILLPAYIFLSSAQKRIPLIFAVFYILTAAFDAILMGFDLFEKVFFFDEVAHFLTAAALAPCCAFYLFYPHLKIFVKDKTLFIISGCAFSMALGSVWEVFEYGFGIGTVSYKDTISDLFFGFSGAAISSFFASSKRVFDHFYETVCSGS
ncbi:MAG: hypothetical protein KC478_15045, partial [Bacteriovoracaceae bacterium]|nr:hypothetical protein [Bacteriovoracaceae bacterium]